MTERITIALIQAHVAKFYGMSVETMLSGGRKRHISMPRSIAIYLTRELTWHTYREIGQAFRREHSGMRLTVERITGWRAARQGLNRDIETLINTLTNPIIPVIHTSMDTLGDNLAPWQGYTSAAKTKGRRYR
jgi:chromosomal replication initiator protein